MGSSKSRRSNTWSRAVAVQRVAYFNDSFAQSASLTSKDTKLPQRGRHHCCGRVQPCAMSEWVGMSAEKAGFLFHPSYRPNWSSSSGLLITNIVASQLFSMVGWPNRWDAMRKTIQVFVSSFVIDSPAHISCVQMPHDKNPPGQGVQEHRVLPAPRC